MGRELRHQLAVSSVQDLSGCSQGATGLHSHLEMVGKAPVDSYCWQDSLPCG